MKFSHISDLHINTYFRDSNLEQTTKLLEYCADNKIDHLFITGDLTDNADELNLLLLRNNLDYFGFRFGERLSIIPGNHDIYGGIQKPDEIFDFPERCRKTDYEEKIDSFNKIMKDSFSNSIYRGKVNGYPYAKIIGDVLIIGVDSNDLYSSVTNPFASNGKVDKSEQKEIEFIIDNFGNHAKFKIVLIHHHFNQMHYINHFSVAGLWQNIEKQTMKLRKKKVLLKLFQKYEIDLVLHGHLHETIHYEREGIKFLNAGGSLKNSNGAYLKINILNTTGERIEYNSVEIPNTSSPLLELSNESFAHAHY
ncbi:MAG: metallophosphoesterase [Ignavibacteria bacterium]|nr:metallophosphoesterase [Ignavibacteria bacterium]MDP3830008.1 metallophosphoesterase [Ignavibacteriaceae bacterium]